jgi:hypothetical protein
MGSLDGLPIFVYDHLMYTKFYDSSWGRFGFWRDFKEPVSEADLLEALLAYCRREHVVYDTDIGGDDNITFAIMDDSGNVIYRGISHDFGFDYDPEEGEHCIYNDYEDIGTTKPFDHPSADRDWLKLFEGYPSGFRFLLDYRE